MQPRSLLIVLVAFVCVFLSNITPTICDLKASLTLRSGSSATVEVRLNDTTATITLTAKSTAWVGTGFGATAMSGTYAIIASGSSTVQERTLGDHASGTQLTNSLTIVSDSTLNSIRTVIATRDLTVSSDYYDFSSITASGDTLDIIWGVGSTTTFAQHAYKGSKTLTFHDPTVSPTQIPTNTPTVPTAMPTPDPTRAPSRQPTNTPTAPTETPSATPSNVPSLTPSGMPTEPTLIPSMGPTRSHTTSLPTVTPSAPSETPTKSPTDIPSQKPTISPTDFPTQLEVLGYVNYTSSNDASYDLGCEIRYYSDNSVFLNIYGPGSQWFGFGFGSQSMFDTYAIIINGNGIITQRILGDHEKGTLLNDSNTSNFSININNVENDVRTIEMFVNDANDLYFDFSVLATESEFDYIMASGEAVDLEYHDWKESGSTSVEMDTTDPSNTMKSSTNEPQPGDSDAANIVAVFGTIVVALIISVVTI